MAAARCRRCGAAAGEADRFCAHCGTRHPSVPLHTAGIQPAGWFADPFGRAPMRFFDGTVWTEHVYGPAGARDPVGVNRSPPVSLAAASWPATRGSLALTLVGYLVANGLAIAFALPYLLLGHPGGALVGLVCSEAGLWAGFFATCVAASRRYGTGRLRSDFGLRFRPVDLGVGATAALVARCCSAAAVVPVLAGHVSVGNADRSLDELSTTGGLGWLTLVLVACVGAPFFEELFFRGLLQSQLVARGGPVLAVALTSVVFGAAHIVNDPGVAGLVLALAVGAGGVALGAVRVLTGRLGSPMVAHSLFNALALVALAVGALTVVTTPARTSSPRRGGARRRRGSR